MLTGVNWEDLHDLVASPPHDVVHCFLFALLVFGTERIGLWCWWLVPCAVVVVWLRIRIIWEQALSLILDPG